MGAVSVARRQCSPDTHLLLVDLQAKGVTGKAAEESLDRAGITCNKNAVPFDPERPRIASGIRLGTPAATTRGFGVEEFRLTGELIGDVLDGLAAHPRDNSAAANTVRARVEALCKLSPSIRGGSSDTLRERQMTRPLRPAPTTCGVVGSSRSRDRP